MAEVKLLCSTALKSSLDILVPRFERDEGVTLDIVYGPSARTRQQIAEGMSTDLAIVTAEGIDDLVKLGRIVPGSRIDLVRSTIAVAVPKGAARPDLSSAETFKQAMLAARSIAMSNPVGGGASGAHLAAVFERLGIADAVRPKLIFGPGGPAGLIGNFLLRGEADIGIQQESELMAVPGIDIVGPLPPELQSVTVFSLGTHVASTHAAVGRALGTFLRAPAAQAVMTEKGLKPA